MKIMKTIVLGLIALLTIAIVPAITFAAESVVTVDTNTIYIEDNDLVLPIKFYISNTDSAAETITVDAYDTILETSTQSFDIPAGTAVTQTKVLNFPLKGLLSAGDYSVKVDVSGANVGPNGTVTLNVKVIEAVPDTLATGLIYKIDFNDEAAPGDTIPVTIELRTDEGQKYEDVTITAWLVEDATGNRVSDREETHEFNIGKLKDNAEEEYTLDLSLPANADEGEYYIMVEVEGDVTHGTNAGRSGMLDAAMSDMIDVERNDHAVDIESVDFESTITSGETVDLAVTLENVGMNDESVRVKVSIPELGIVQTSKEIMVEEDELVTAYFTLNVPGTADAGEYTMTVKVYNADLTETSDFALVIKSTGAPAATGLTVNVDSTTKTISNVGGVYALTVTNNGDDVRTLNFEVAGTSNWAQASVNPSTVVIQPGTSKIVSVFVSPKDGVKGTHQFTLFVKDGASVLDSQTLTANIAPSFMTFGNLSANTAMKWVIGFLVLVLVVLFVVWSWRKEEKTEGKKRGYY